VKKVFCVFICLFSLSANATVILDDFSITGTNLSFNVSGTASTLGAGAHGQILFGLVDDSTTDWITSFDAGASSWVEGASNAVSIGSVYSLSGSFFSDSLLTISADAWELGDLIDITFNFVGVFNVANFDLNNFGMSVGYSGGSIVDSTINLVTSSVPEPSILILLSLGLAGLGLRRRKLLS